MQPRTFALLAAALVLPFAGCTTTNDERASPEVIRAVADLPAMTWARGNHWTFDATFHQNATYAIALVVHESRADGFRLGSNVSSGFFGLPFNGNVSKELNPQIGAEVWPMYRFPLQDGKTWEYTMFGYDAKTTAYAAVVDVPGVGHVPGYRLEASYLGQVFARYDYAPPVGWFTQLQLLEPTKREEVLMVRLTGYGAEYGRPYFVERVLETRRVDYPALPGEVELRVPSGYAKVRATLTVETTAGAATAKLVDAQGRVILEAQALAKGVATDRATLPARAGTWTLEHAGAGKGVAYLEVTGLSATNGLPGAWRETPKLVFGAA